MKRYINSFLITLSFYVLFGFSIYYFYSNNKIEIVEEPKLSQTISLKYIELKPEVNDIVEEEIVKIGIKDEKIKNLQKKTMRFIL